MSKVTREQAEKVLAAVKAAFPLNDPNGPNLRDHDHEELREGSWSIDWEGGPEDWPMHFWPEYNGTPDAVAFTEPINGVILGVFPR